jgi:hypothetical protein
MYRENISGEGKGTSDLSEMRKPSLKRSHIFYLNRNIMHKKEIPNSSIFYHANKSFIQFPEPIQSALLGFFMAEIILNLYHIA